MYPCPLMFLFFFTLTWESSKSWCALGCPSFLLSHLFRSPTWDCSQSLYALGCPPFLLSLSGVVAGVGVPLAIHLWLFLCCFFFFLFSFFFVDTPMWDSGKSWCAPGCPSFLLKPKWHGSRSWCTPGQSSFFVCSCCCLNTNVGQ